MPLDDRQQCQAVTNMPLPCLIWVSYSCRHRAWAHVIMFRPQLSAWGSAAENRSASHSPVRFMDLFTSSMYSMYVRSCCSCCWVSPALSMG